ncbi:MAG TPA: TonB-dependent receptor, partial [Caulobacterales bacterium]|nr:TonB-dependent receptor [Caulobacterales bacterium]
LNLLAGIGVSVLALVPAKAAQAQAQSQPAPRTSSSEIGEVVVTATKAGVTNLQKTPLSVAVVGGADLDASRIVTLRDLASSVAALKITNNNSNVVVTIRGVGGYASNNEQDVGIYQDGVYLGRSSVALNSNFNDLERVEVVKGPQGTTFGRNSVGGALNFISKGPTDTFEFENTLNLGNYNLRDEAFRLGGPIIKDKVSGTLAFSYYNHDGYIKNLIPNVGDAGAANRYSARAQLKFDLASNVTNLLRADYGYTDEDHAVNSTLYLRTDDPRFLTCNTTTLVCNNTPAVGVRYAAPIANSKVGDYHYYANPNRPHISEWVYGVNDEFTWEINDKLTFKNLVAYRTAKTNNFTFGNGTEYFTGGTLTTYRQHQFSEEMNLQNNLGKLSGVVGLYYWQEYQRQVGDSIGSLIAPPVRTSTGAESYQDTRFPTKSTAIFFNESFHFTPELSLTVGARYTKEKKTLDTYNTSFSWSGLLPAGWIGSIPPYGVRGATSASTIVLNIDGSVNGLASVVFPYIKGYGTAVPALTQDVEAFTPKVGVEWQATEDAFLYGSVTRGFKSGGFNFTARNDFGASYQPEWITSYEIGAKTDWFDKRLRINLAAFRNNWTNLQVSQAVILPNLSTPVTQSSNAASARITGLDADITAKPGAGFTFNAGFTWLPDAKYLDYTGGQAANYIKNLLIQAKDPRENAGFNTYNANGNRLNKAPRFSGIFNADKKFELGDSGDITIHGDVAYTSPTAYDISNHPLSISKPLTLYNANINYTSPGGHYEVGFWGRNLADKSYANSIIIGSLPQVVSGAPRTFGIRLNYKY